MSDIIIIGFTIGLVVNIVALMIQVVSHIYIRRLDKIGEKLDRNLDLLESRNWTPWEQRLINKCINNLDSKGGIDENKD